MNPLVLLTQPGEAALDDAPLVRPARRNVIAYDHGSRERSDSNLNSLGRNLGAAP
jgi:hypothetical protein